MNKSKNQPAQNKNIASAGGNGQQNEGGSLLEKFFVDQLKDIYYAEQQLLKALPEMQKDCSTE
jgi:hypothetical protein